MLTTSTDHSDADITMAEASTSLAAATAVKLARLASHLAADPPHIIKRKAALPVPGLFFVPLSCASGYPDRFLEGDFRKLVFDQFYIGGKFWTHGWDV